MHAGLLSRRQLDAPVWRPLFRDVYVHRDVPVDHELRAQAACLLLPAAVITGRSAAVLWGIDLAGPNDPVEVTVPPSAHPCRIPGLRVRRAHLDPEHRWHRRSLPVTTAAATALRLAAVLPEVDAVAAVDQLVMTGVADLETIRALARTATGPNSARARRVCGLADGLAESPQETRLRLLIAASRLPLPVAQFHVMAGRIFVARVDFAWPDRRLALEYDGLWHAEPGQFARDRQRLNRLQAAGWRVIFVTAADLHHPDQLVARIAEAIAR